MKKKILLIPLALLLVISLVACAAPAPAPAPPPAPAPAPAPAPSPKVIWRLPTMESNLNVWHVKADADFAKRVAERTDGGFEIQVSIEGEIGIPKGELAMACSEGLIEMFVNSTGGLQGTFSHCGVFLLPFLIGPQEGPLKDSLVVLDAVHDITVREMNKVGIEPLFHYVAACPQIISKEPIEDLSDLKGLKTRAWAKTIADMVTNLNGVPVVMSVSETYVAMQRGVVDAVMTGVPSMNGQSLYEVGKYLYLINLAPSIGYTCFNIEAFEALPEEYQVILREEAEPTMEWLVEMRPIEDQKAIDIMVEAGVEVLEVPPEQMARVVEKVNPLWGEWANEAPLHQETYEAAVAALGL